MKTYIYKLKDLKKAKQYFSVYNSEDGDEVYAISLLLDKESRPVKHIIKMASKIYTNGDEATRADFEKEGLVFKKASRKKDEKNYVLKPTEKDYECICKATLCFILKGDTKKYLFINAADHTEYYDTESVKACCNELIEMLLNEQVIYEKRMPKEFK